MKQIPTINPSNFKQVFMSDYNRFQLDRKYYDDFFIADYSKQTYKLKLPLTPHRKTVNDIILLTEGTMSRSSGLDTYILKKNCLFLLPAGQVTETTTMSEKVKGFYIHFSNDYLFTGNFDFTEWINKPFISISHQETGRLVYLLQQIEHYYYNNFHPDLIKSYLNTLLTEIRHLSGYETKPKLSASEKVVLSFKKSLSEDITKERSVSYYAGKLNITRNHLNKCTKAVLNKSASMLVSEMLILEAKVLINKNKRDISELAFSLGFKDPSYFGRFFKKHTGLTPTEFAKMIYLSD